MNAWRIFFTKYYLLDFQIVIRIANKVNILSVDNQECVFWMLFEECKVAFGYPFEVIGRNGLLVAAPAMPNIL